MPSCWAGCATFYSKKLPSARALLRVKKRIPRKKYKNFVITLNTTNHLKTPHPTARWRCFAGATKAYSPLLLKWVMKKKAAVTHVKLWWLTTGAFVTKAAPPTAGWAK